MDQPGTSPFESADDDADRIDTRDSLFLMAAMTVVGSARVEQLRVRNLSAGGLMAEYPRGLDQGTPVVFTLRGLGEVAGRVAWSAAGRVGIAFDRIIDPMLARKPVANGKPVLPEPGKAIFGRG